MKRTLPPRSWRLGPWLLGCAVLLAGGLAARAGVATNTAFIAALAASRVARESPPAAAPAAPVLATPDTSAAPPDLELAHKGADLAVKYLMNKSGMTYRETPISPPGAKGLELDSSYVTDAMALYAEPAWLRYIPTLSLMLREAPVVRNYEVNGLRVGSPNGNFWVGYEKQEELRLQQWTLQWWRGW